MSVYLALQRSFGNLVPYNKTITIQKCGDSPYKLVLRFAKYCLKYGTYFASGYLWEEKFYDILDKFFLRSNQDYYLISIKR